MEDENVDKHVFKMCAILYSRYPAAKGAQFRGRHAVMTVYFLTITK
jgi:hypothetical protein